MANKPEILRFTHQHFYDPKFSISLNKQAFTSHGKGLYSAAEMKLMPNNGKMKQFRQAKAWMANINLDSICGAVVKILELNPFMGFELKVGCVRGLLRKANFHTGK